MVKHTLLSLISDERGSTAIDYALIAAVVSVGAILGYAAFANSAGNVWTFASDTILAALK
ncbi:MAG: pilus assembly protein Flp/PilA [Myxococcota bacterium]|jgi:pilus assembly protein Flp/PilA